MEACEFFLIGHNNLSFVMQNSFVDGGNHLIQLCPLVLQHPPMHLQRFRTVKIRGRQATKLLSHWTLDAPPPYASLGRATALHLVQLPSPHHKHRSASLMLQMQDILLSIS